MRKLKSVFVGIIISMALLCGGCSDMVKDYLGNYGINQPSAELSTQEQEISSETSTAEAEDADAGTVQQEEEISELYYAYHKLDSTRQTLYREIFHALENMEESVELSTTDTELIDTTFACVVNDHPELFFVDGYQYTEYGFDDIVTSVVFQGTYTKTSAEVRLLKQQIEQRLSQCLAGVPESGDEYDIVKYLYEYLINSTEYDKSAADNQNICSVFLNGRSVCQGYAEAFQYMLQNMGIQAFVVTGFTNSERHAWNLVRVNGEYYYIDPTWGDASYTLEGEAADSVSVPPINFDYFLVTTDELTRTHSIERAVELPECTSTKDNYFVREGLYFDRYDEDRLRQIFDSDNAKSADFVTIKCSTIKCYDELTQHLVENQEIFNYVNGQGESVAYTSNQYQRTISFWNIFY